MIDEGGGPQPQLCTVFTGGVHDAEVVLAVTQQKFLLNVWQLCDAAYQKLDLIVSFPVRQWMWCEFFRAPWKKNKKHTCEHQIRHIKGLRQGFLISVNVREKSFYPLNKNPTP